MGPSVTVAHWPSSSGAQCVWGTVQYWPTVDVSWTAVMVFWHHLLGTRTKGQRHRNTCDAPPPTKFHPQEPHGRKNQHFKLVTSPPLTPPTNSKTPQNWTGSCGSWSISAGLWIIYLLPPFTTPNREFYKSEKAVLILKPLDCFEPQAALQAEQYFPGYGNFIPLIAKLCKRSFWICPPQRGQCYRMSSQASQISGLFLRTRLIGFLGENR